MPHCWPDKTVLIAEDEPINYMLISKILESTQVTVRWVKNGVDAVKDASSDTPPDLILMDLRMPEMDGLTATQVIRKDHAEMPIIAVTAFNLSDEHDQCIEAGCSGFLTKPVMPKTLLEKMSEYFS